MSPPTTIILQAAIARPATHHSGICPRRNPLQTLAKRVANATPAEMADVVHILGAAWSLLAEFHLKHAGRRAPSAARSAGLPAVALKTAD